MLRYSEFGLSHREVPGENSICIYITGCIYKCHDCHYPELQLSDYGLELCKYYNDILELYIKQASCVVFMGEGNCNDEERKELLMYSDIAHKKGLKSCLYSGRDTDIEEWMNVFDYIKVGSYTPEFGGLDSPKTNQRMYQLTRSGYTDITDTFWK